MLALIASISDDLPKSGGKQGFGVGGIWSKGLVILYVLMPLVAIPETLLREMEGHKKFLTSGGLHNGLASMDALTGGALLVS